MTPRMFGVVAALAIATVQIGAAQAGINQRNTIAKARIGGSPNNRDGGYESTGVSGVCGEIPSDTRSESNRATRLRFAAKRVSICAVPGPKTSR